MRIVLLSLSATTCTLRTTPIPSATDNARWIVLCAVPGAAVVVCVWLTTVWLGFCTGITGCAWKDGGETIVPAGVPGASVGGPVGSAGWVIRPVNACCNSGAMRSARPFCT